MKKSVVITGSSRGIGFEMALCFLKNGFNVTLSGRSEGLPHDAERILGEYSGKYIYIGCNVRNRTDLQNLWDESCRKWKEIDIWINNAGRNAPHEYSWETDGENTKAIIETNITGMIYGSQIAASGMIEQGHGEIYSMEGLGSNDMIQKKTVLYGATKRSLTYFMKGLARELEGTGVIAGRLSPGMMLTDFITKGPDGNASEVLQDKDFRRIFNILGDRPATVAGYIVPRIIRNERNDAHIVWLTRRKAAMRFMLAPLLKRKLI